MQKKKKRRVKEVSTRTVSKRQNHLINILKIGMCRLSYHFKTNLFFSGIPTLHINKIRDYFEFFFRKTHRFSQLNAIFKEYNSMNTST